MLCLASAGLLVQLAASGFTLAWTHSVEKIRWEEDWRTLDGRLVIVESRVQGSGAGMEAADGAVLRDGFWRWHPSLPPQPELWLARSGATADWDLCVDEKCQPLERLLGPAGGTPVRLTACAESPPVPPQLGSEAGPGRG